MDYLDKNVVITGGASGIGWASAQLFAAKHANVFILDKVKPPYENDRLHYVPCDVSNVVQVSNAILMINASTYSLDYVFANAGIYLLANVVDTTQAELDNVLNINFKGIFYTLQCVLPLMQAQGHGSIVLMGSDQTLIAKSKSAIYGATKAAIGHLAKSTAIDYGCYNIRVNCICPGTVETPLYQQVVGILAEKQNQSRAAIEEKFRFAQPLCRLGRPEEIAELVMFLCSEKAAYINGALISIDGGFTAH